MDGRCGICYIQLATGDVNGICRICSERLNRPSAKVFDVICPNCGHVIKGLCSEMERVTDKH